MSPVDAAPHEAFLRQAIRLSLESVAQGGGPFGAVVVCAGRVIGTGQNRVTLHRDPTAHAEIVALREACRSVDHFALRGCELYTSCEPCPMCLGAILWARIDRVWFGNTREDAAAIGFDDREFYEEICRPLMQRRLPMHGLLRHEAQAAFQAWTGHAERTPY
jgi:tRNA(Arg) A34 adenosine deaminase TadA